ncbi:MAG: hypothetical protein ACKOA0_14180 [Burkholderiaceae bacterium]
MKKKTGPVLDDLIVAGKINLSYVSRILRLAYLSPKIVQAILDGKQPAWLTMKELLKPSAAEWSEQEQIF